MTQLSMWETAIPEQRASKARKKTAKRIANMVRPSIESRFAVFAKENPHVLAEALKLARSWLARGDRYISAKAIYEAMRTRVKTTGEAGYRLNNDFTANISRWLQDAEPTLVGVLRMRERKT